VASHGIASSLRLAQGLHWAMLALLALFGLTAGLGAIYYASLSAIAGALIYEHRSAAALDIAAINRAFFWSNAFVGLVFVAGVLAAVLVR